MAEFDSAIPPGGSGRIVASVDTTRFEGRRTKTVAVRTNDPDRPALTLSLVFDARPPIQVLPARHVRITTLQGHTGRAFVILRRDDGEPVELGAIETSTDALRVALVDPATMAGADGESDARAAGAGGTPAGGGRGEPGPRRARAESFEQLTARLGVEPRPGDRVLRVELIDVDEPLQQRGRIQLATNHPKAPQVELPFQVQVRQILVAHPRVVNLVLAPTRQPGLGRVSLRHSAGRDFGVTVARVEGDLPGVSVRVTTSGEVLAHQLELKVEDAGSPAGVYKGEVVAETSLRRSPEVRVPVTLRVSPRRPDAPAARAERDPPEAGGS